MLHSRNVRSEFRFKLLFALLCVLVFSEPIPAQSIITTVAGSDDQQAQVGALAQTARLGAIPGMAVDPRGNLSFISFFGTSQGYVLSIGADGRLHVLAGTGTTPLPTGLPPCAFMPGGCPTGPTLATSVSLYPGAIAWDASGNLYVADVTSQVVKKVAPDGSISDFTRGSGVLAVDRAGNVYLFDYQTHQIKRVGPDGTITIIAGNGQGSDSGDGGPALNAGIDFIARMAVDGLNNIFFFENSLTTTYRTRVRRITPDGKINAYAGSLSASTFSGDGGPALAAGLGNISDIAADAQGNLYILAGYNRVRKVAPNGVITTIAGNGFADLTGDGGPAISASLINPTTIAVDTTGNLYVAGDLGIPFSTPRYSYHIRKITPDGIISTIAGYSKTGFAGDGGPATKATFFLPWAMTFDSAGNLYIVDVGDHRVRKVTPDGIVSAFAGDGRPNSAGDGGPAVDAGMSPMDVAVDMSGNAYVADGNRIRRVTPDGLISTVVGDGMCGFTGDGGSGVQAEICFAGGLAADTQGNVYIADAGNHRIRKLDANGTINTVAGTGSTTASGDGGLAVNAGLDSLGSILVDSQKNLFLSQLSLRSIRRIGPGGIISTFAGNRTQGYSGDGGPATSASLGDVSRFFSLLRTFFNYGLATDQAGTVYISIPGNHGGERIRRVTPDGIIQTIAGNGNMAFAGDGGPALQASFDTPVGMAMDAFGNLFVADLFNARIRRIAPPLVPAVAGGGIVNGASFVSGGLVPGEMATIFGSNLTSATGINPALSLPLGTELQNVEVKINGNPVPLFAVDNVNGQQQINFQAPWELAGQLSARLQVVNYGTSSPTISVPVLAAQPGIFSYNAAGKTFGAILHANYQLADTGHPAAGGEVVLIYCTSLGAVSPQAQTGAAASGAELTVAKPTVTVGGAPAVVNFSGLAPGFVGLNQINTQVPSGLAPGNQPVVITISGASSSPVLLPVQ